METNNLNTKYQNNMYHSHEMTNPVILSLLFSLCISLVLTLAGVIVAYTILAEFFSPDFFELLFNEVTLKSFIIIFIISDSIILLQATLLFIASKIFGNCSPNFFMATDISLKAFKLPIILIGASLIFVKVHYFITALFVLTAILLLVINLYEGSKKLFQLSDSKVLLITPICIILNYGIIAWVTTNYIKSYIEDLMSNFLFF